MGEEKKEQILRFLKLFPDKRLSVKKLHQAMNKKMTYQTLLKWVLVLEAEKKIIIEDYGNVKIIKINEGDSSKKL